MTLPATPPAGRITVSAVIPTYNRKPYLRRALDSVLAQTVPVDEVIVVDDGSTDGTAEAVAAWYGPAVRVVRQENAGVSGARRRGVQEARCEWVAFLDSDDEWLPERNRDLLEAARRVPADVSWIFGDLVIVTDQGEGKTVFQEYGLQLPESPHILPDPLTIVFPIQFGFFQGSYIRRSVLLELGCFTTGLRSDDDLVAGFQVACRYRVAAIDSVVGKYFRTSDLSGSSSMLSGIAGPDHYHARMMAFACAVEAGREGPWREWYALEVRGLCQALARQGKVPRRLALEQFRFATLSPKAVAFTAAAMLGRRGVLGWMALARFLKRRRPAGPARRQERGWDAQVKAAWERSDTSRE